MEYKLLTIRDWYYCSLLVVLMISGCATASLGTKKQQALAGKVFVITGASSGLGKGIALQAARYKAKVVIASRNAEALEKVAGEIRQLGGTALVVTVDVSDLSQMEALLQQAVRTFGKIDVWVNNAGVAVIGHFWETPLADQERVIDVNLKGVLYGSYLAIGRFKEQGYGKLINIGSVESEIPTAYQAAYSASKSAVRSIGLVLRQELRLAGYRSIQVTTISPWALDTPLWDHAATYTGHAPRMIMMDATQKAVNAVMHAATGKKREIPVGWKAHFSYGGHRFLPALTERLGSDIAHKYQADITPAQKDTTGNLYRSGSERSDVDGGFQDRMKEEKKARSKEK